MTWSLHNDCHGIDFSSWNERVVGCTMYILNHRMKRLKVKLKALNHDIFGNVHSFVKEDEDIVNDVQVKIQTNGHSYVLMKQERLA